MPLPAGTAVARPGSNVHPTPRRPRPAATREDPRHRGLRHETRTGDHDGQTPGQRQPAGQMGGVRRGLRPQRGPPQGDREARPRLRHDHPLRPADHPAVRRDRRSQGRARARRRSRHLGERAGRAGRGVPTIPAQRAPQPQESGADLCIHLFASLSDALVPHLGGQRCPADLGPIRLSMAEDQRLEDLEERYTTGLITWDMLMFGLRWSQRRRCHQPWPDGTTAAATSRPSPRPPSRQRPEGGSRHVTTAGTRPDALR